MTPSHRSLRCPTLLTSLLALLLGACGGGGTSAGPTPDAALPVPDDIEDFLRSVPGLRFEALETEYPGYTNYSLWYEQPLDHEDPESPRFEQRMVLHHIDREAPMVLYTSGYALFSTDYVSELGVAMAANQISTEQRFFAESRPEQLHWSEWAYLTIEQAANDHHRIVTALAPYYDGRWLSTGHSKGGMTSIYHRRFFPDDVDATVAYVAPISFGAPDTRYETFFDTVGDQACRDALSAVQIAGLERFGALLPLARSEAADAGMTFERAGGQAASFEGEIAGMHWSFWQYYGWRYCDSIPAPDAPDADLFAFIAEVGGIGSDDESIGKFEPYYYQASVQLGFPSVPTDHVDELRTHEEVGVDYLPRGAQVFYDDSAAMNDIDAWVQGTDASLMFIYGEYDPWSGGMFELGDATDAHRYTVAQAPHGANIRGLSDSDRNAALDTIAGWMGVRPTFEQFFGPLRPVPIVRVPNPTLRARR